jgi:hypothetical protein
MQDQYDRIKARWQDLGVLRDGVSAADIDRFEQQCGVRLPFEMAAFYRTMDGTNAMEEALISFWPLEEVGPVPEKLSSFQGVPDYREIATTLPEAATYFAFADHSIWVNVYAVRITQDLAVPNTVVWISGHTWKVIDDSFADFMARYALDPESVLVP